jgi:hypothetical protein
MAKLKTSEAQRRASKSYRQRMRDDGWGRIDLWVPEDLREEIIVLVNKTVRENIEARSVEAS